MLNPEELQALGVDPDTASSIQESQFTLAQDLTVEIEKQDRTLPGADPVEVLEALTHPIDKHELGDRERALRIAYLADAAGALGLELATKVSQEVKQNG